MAITQCIIHRDLRDDSNENRLLAAAKLGEIAYKLYTYLECFPLGEQLYERIKFVKTVDTNYKSADKAFNKLEELGFLKQVNNLNYIFIANPQQNTRIQFQNGNIYTESKKS